MSSDPLDNGAEGNRKLSPKMRLRQLNEKKIPLAGGLDEGDQTMQIFLNEEDERNQALQIPEDRVRPKHGNPSEEARMSEAERLSEEGPDWTIRLPDLSQDGESDRTMMINFDNRRDDPDAADRTMRIPGVFPEEGFDQTMRIDGVVPDEDAGGAFDRTMRIDGVIPDTENEGSSDRTMQIDVDTAHAQRSGDRTMLIHLKKKTASDSEWGEVQSHSSESKTARYARVLPPGEPKKRASTLPLSMSKADESRHSPMGDPGKRSSVPRVLPSSSSRMSEMRNENRLWAWTRTLHPTRGWLFAVLLFPLSGLAFSSFALFWMLPDHPGPLPLAGSESFVTQYVIPDIATGYLLWVTLAMLAQILFSGAGGRPPLVWTLKLMVFAMLPFAFVRIGWMAWIVFVNGLESFLRGYRSPGVQIATPLMYSLTAGFTVWILAKAAASPHCQANEKRVLFSFSLVPLLFLTGYFASLQLQSWRFEQRVGPSWRRAEQAWSQSRAQEALPLLEEVLDFPRILTPQQKARFYQMRGELLLQQGVVLKAREDFVRTVQLLPPSHAENRLARAANLLALERLDLARVQLQIAEEMRPASANVHRWHARISLGDFDPDQKNPQLAHDYALRAVELDPSPVNRALLARTEKTLNTP